MNRIVAQVKVRFVTATTRLANFYDRPLTETELREKCIQVRNLDFGTQTEGDLSAVFATKGDVLLAAEGTHDQYYRLTRASNGFGWQLHVLVQASTVPGFLAHECYSTEFVLTEKVGTFRETRSTQTVIHILTHFIYCPFLIT